VTVAGAGPSSETIRVIPVEARPYQGRRAGIVSRSLALAIDAGVVVLLVLAAYGLWAGFLFVLHGRTFRFPTVALSAAITAGIATFVAYCTIGWATAGRTYGGQVLGLRVVDRAGLRLRPARAFLRAVLSAAFPLGLLWCAVSAENRSIQDLVLATSVIYDWEVRPQRPARIGTPDASDEATS
jgi:uncharacterized RDD family membrane protein YckC